MDKIFPQKDDVSPNEQFEPQKIIKKDCQSRHSKYRSHSDFQPSVESETNVNKQKGSKFRIFSINLSYGDIRR